MSPQSRIPLSVGPVGFISMLVMMMSLPAAGPLFGSPPPAPDVLTEDTASDWGAQADGATATVFNDTSRVKAGASSLRLETNAPFDCWMWTPLAKDAHWNVLMTGGPTFWIYAENSNSSFQNNSPWIEWHCRPKWFSAGRLRFHEFLA